MKISRFFVASFHWNWINFHHDKKTTKLDANSTIDFKIHISSINNLLFLNSYNSLNQLHQIIVIFKNPVRQQEIKTINNHRRIFGDSVRCWYMAPPHTADMDLRSPSPIGLIDYLQQSTKNEQK